jgi:hypothetical protein
LIRELIVEKQAFEYGFYDELEKLSSRERLSCEGRLYKEAVAGGIVKGLLSSGVARKAANLVGKGALFGTGFSLLERKMTPPKVRYEFQDESGSTGYGAY